MNKISGSSILAVISWSICIYSALMILSGRMAPTAAQGVTLLLTFGTAVISGMMANPISRSRG